MVMVKEKRIRKKDKKFIKDIDGNGVTGCEPPSDDDNHTYEQIFSASTAFMHTQFGML